MPDDQYEPRSRTPLYRSYGRVKTTALEKGAAWHLSFEAWMQVWLDSGHLAERGTLWKMARIDETGPYAFGNVHIVRFRKGKRKRLPPRMPGDSRHTCQDYDSLSTTDEGAWRVKCVEGNARFVAAMRAAHPGREGVSEEAGTEFPRVLPRPQTPVASSDNWNW